MAGRPDDGGEREAVDAAAAAVHGQAGRDHVRAAGAGWRPRSWRRGITLPIACGVGIGILLAQGLSAIYQQLRGILAIVVVSLFLSFALEPAVQWQARRGVRRGLGTWAVFLAAIALIGGFTFAMASLVVDQVRTLVSTAPNLLEDLATQAERLPGEAGEVVATWLAEQQQLLPSRAAAAFETIGRGAWGIGQTLVGAVFQLATIALVTFYLVADGPRIRQRLASRLPVEQQVRVLGVWELAIAKTGGYVYSRALTAVISAAFHVAVFSLIGLPYAVALGVWVGLVSSVIPAVGTYLAGALPVVVALATSPAQALWVLVAITAYQQVENYLVVPKITASTVELHPAVAFLSVIAGATLAGATGALLAIPAVAIVTSLLAAATEEYDVLEHELVVIRGQAAVDRMRERRARPGDRAGRGREWSENGFEDPFEDREGGDAPRDDRRGET